MAKTISAKMATLIASEVLTLATCWKVTRTDGVKTFITDHDTDILFAGDTYVAASGIARTAIESSADMSVDNLDVVGIFGGIFSRNDMDGGFYDFAEIDIFSVDWQDPDGTGKLQHRFGVIGEVETKDGGYIAEMRGLMQLLERKRGKLWSPDCRTDVFSPQVNTFSGRADGCGLNPALFEEFGVVTAVTDDRKMTVGEFSQLALEPKYAGEFGDVQGVHEVDGKVEMVLTIADKSPMRPTVITTKAELQAIDQDLNGYYVLGNDIIIGVWDNPPGTNADPFRGTFDGRGFKLRDVTADTSGTGGGPAGLFGVVTGTVRRVHIARHNTRSSATEWSGAICARLLSAESGNHPLAGAGRVEQCQATAGIQLTDGDKSGGLIGEVGDFTIVRDNFVSALRNGVEGDDTGGCVGRSAGDTVIASNNFCNTDQYNSTDLGNITGGGVGGYFGQIEADWPTKAKWTFPFTDVRTMNSVPGPVSATIDFEGTIVITRTVGSFITDGMEDDDHMTITGSASNDGTYTIRRVLSSGLRLVLKETITPETGQAITYTTVGGPKPLSPGRF